MLNYHTKLGWEMNLLGHIGRNIVTGAGTGMSVETWMVAR
jgi:hypothetical protein